MSEIWNDIKPKLSWSYLRQQPLFVNMASLGILQMANYIIPIIVIPFVVRALGAEAFGKASYAQNIIAYLTILVNYGFEYSATQEVAINRNNPTKLQNIFWTVVASKFCLLLLSFLVLAGLYFVFPRVHEDLLLYIFAALINVGFVLFPTWFFQGMEKMAKMAIFNFVIRLVSGTLVILLITAPEQYRYYLLISSSAYIVVGLVAFFYVLHVYKIRFSSAHQWEKKVVRKGFPIFLNNLCATLYTTAGFTILGLYFADQELGYYAGAYKIIMAFIMLTSMPVSMALFPMISREFDASLERGFSILKKCCWIAGAASLLISICIFLLSPLLVRILLGEGFEASIGMLRTFSPLPFLIVMASMFTVQGLYGLQLQRFAPYVGLTVGISCVALTFLLIPSCGVYSAIIGYVIAEFLEILCSGSIVLIKYRRACK